MILIRLNCGRVSPGTFTKTIVQAHPQTSTPTHLPPDNIVDWCVSRQLWWGHRVPAYRIVVDGMT